ncbi:Helix-turn-helix [Nocardiopsis flavescens]|uniref:Helix-turn-helix n=1 Tax=Nocardiopsis flavescens TaxID=758803 RepID=A0A1M6KH81_9ACTN|nr:HNH endonuclease [Nocardiopsis flavescens]SHJ58333.1 Helix-turn-helix [Nocardiopsis flavescens]
MTAPADVSPDAPPATDVVWTEFDPDTLRRARTERGLSQWGLGQRCGLAYPGSISRYERGRQAPGQDTLVAIACALDTPVDAFFRRVALPDRFWAKVDKTSSPSGCWLWTAGTDWWGYAEFSVNGQSRGAHRVAYAALVGPIPDGLTIDHLCRVRHCVNPGHLEPVSIRENTLRGNTITAANAAKTRCGRRGHPFDEANTRIGSKGERRCRACDNEVRRARKAARRKAAV